MTTVQDPRHPVRSCPPWCADEHRTDDPGDQQCRSDYDTIPQAVIVHDIDEVPGGGAIVVSDLRVALEARTTNAPARVLLNTDDDVYLPLTVEGARQLAEHLIARADEAEGGVR